MKHLFTALVFMFTATSAQAAPSTLKIVLSTLHQRGFTDVTADSNVRGLIGVEPLVSALVKAHLPHPKYRSTVNAMLLTYGCEKLSFWGSPFDNRDGDDYTPRCLAMALDAATAADLGL